MGHEACFESLGVCLGHWLLQVDTCQLTQTGPGPWRRRQHFCSACGGHRASILTRSTQAGLRHWLVSLLLQVANFFSASLDALGNITFHWRESVYEQVKAAVCQTVRRAILKNQTGKTGGFQSNGASSGKVPQRHQGFEKKNTHKKMQNKSRNILSMSQV